MTERQSLSLMAMVSLASLVCYTTVLRLCRKDAQGHLSPEEQQRRRRLAYAAHGLDWLMNVLVALVGVGRMLQADNFGGYRMGRLLKIYFVITGPLPTLGMVATMITAHRWGERMHSEPRLRRIHRGAALLGYVSWWFSVLPIFVMPFFRVKQEVTGYRLQVTGEAGQEVASARNS